MRRLQRSKLLTFALIGVLLTGSFGAGASAAEAGAPAPGESFAISGECAEADTPAETDAAEADRSAGTGDTSETGAESGRTAETGEESGKKTETGAGK